MIACRLRLSPAPLPVTVLIPAYDREVLLRRAVASVLTQYPAAAAQVLVIDDGSSDRTAEVAESLGVDVVRHDRNRGLSAGRNTGLREAKFDWVALLDSDDEWLPDHLATLWEIRDSHLFVAGSALGISSSARRWHGPHARQVDVIDSPARLMFPENFIPASATMLRRDAALEAGGYDEELRKVEDLDMLIRLLERGTGAAVPSLTCIYHLHDAQMSSDGVGMRDAHAAVIRKYDDRPWWTGKLDRSFRGLREWDEGRAALRGNDPAAAIRHAARIAADPALARAVIEVLAWRSGGRRMLRRSPFQIGGAG